jgi:Ion channel
MSSLIPFLRNHRSESLMCVFTALLLASPLGDSRPHVGGIIALLILVAMVVGTTHMANRRTMRRVVFPLAALWVVARALEAWGDGRHAYAHLAPIAGLALSCAILWALLNRFGSLPLVTSGVISEAFISYLVLAIAFSQVYWILNHFVDNAFNQVIEGSRTSTFLYFSMVTLSDVGYGAIVPVNPYVRLVSAFESMLGVFYIAVVVARLVSSYRRRDDCST